MPLLWVMKVHILVLGSLTTGWHACKVKKHFSYNMHLFLAYLLRDSQTIHSMIHLSKPLLCVTLLCSDWSISFKAVCSVTLCTALPWKQLQKWQQVGGTMLMFDVDVSVKRLGIRFKNDSIQWFRVDSFFWETGCVPIRLLILCTKSMYSFCEEKVHTFEYVAE